jgi:hypothetical protein
MTATSKSLSNGAVSTLSHMIAPNIGLMRDSVSNHAGFLLPSDLDFWGRVQRIESMADYLRVDLMFKTDTA